MAKRTPAAIVGAATLLGREVVEQIQEQKLAVATHLFSGEPTAVGGNIAVEEGEPVFYEPLTAESLAPVKLILLAGSPESSERALKLSSRTSRLIDLTGCFDQRKQAVIRAPYGQTAASSPDNTRITICAHPAATAIELLLSSVESVGPIRASVITIFEPASERGQAGISELQKQTAALLSFQKPPSAIFDTQAAYNMLSQYGEDAPVSLLSIEERIARHIDALAAQRPGRPAAPSIRLVQAPVFHGYSFNVWIEFESKLPDRERLRSALRHPLIDLRTEETEPPTNMGAAQQSGLFVAEPRADRGNPRACWIWMACDNLRVSAENAVMLLKELL